MSILDNPTLHQTLKLFYGYESVTLYNIHDNEFYIGEVLGAFDLPEFVLNKHVMTIEPTFTNENGVLQPQLCIVIATKYERKE